LVGYPSILDKWSLPNPAILGPGFYDHPNICPDLMKDPRFKHYIVTCDWMKSMFEAAYGPTCFQWYAGIDTNYWVDTRYHEKTVDVLIYDKIRWNREQYEPSLLIPVINTIERRGLSYQIVRYRQYKQAKYRKTLSRCRSMIFLCEHETQGLAYQEALASNVPILAWDNGFWLDPRRELYDPNPVPASSVPYFSPECGERFSGIDQFEHAFSLFWEKLATFEPRAYVERELSFAGSADRYLQGYAPLARPVEAYPTAMHVPSGGS
jgi:hypothetical protein